MFLRDLSIAALAAGTMLTAVPAAAAQTPVQFNLINIGGAGQGTVARRGFDAAAAYWASVLTTSAPVTVNLNIGFQALPPNVLGSTGSAYYDRSVNGVVNRLAAQGHGAFDAALKLPTLVQTQAPGQLGVQMYTPGYTDPVAMTGIDNATKVYDTDGSYNNFRIGVTGANSRALGYNVGSAVDATIRFSSQFPFDFNPLDGITAGRYDFIGVAIHEIGHALGFTSGADDYDVLGTGGPYADEVCLSDGTLCKNYPANDDWFGHALDLFRYSAAGTLDWTTNTASYFSADGGATAYGNGYFSTGSYNGDGWQASHWKAPEVPPFCTGLKGIMNSYLCNGRQSIVTGLDLAALDAIGWNIKDGVGGLGYSANTRQILLQQITVPEPSSWAMLIAGFGLTGAALRRRRGTVATA